MEDLIPDPEKNHSRKFLLAIGTLVVLLVAWFATLVFPPLGALYGEFISGVIALVGIYYTGNVANKHVVGKQKVSLEAVLKKRKEEKEES